MQNSAKPVAHNMLPIRFHINNSLGSEKTNDIPPQRPQRARKKGDLPGKKQIDDKWPVLKNGV
jgi:hypothetical protein